MKRDDLIKLLLSEGETDPTAEQKALIDKIMALHGKDIEQHKNDAATAQASVTTLQAQLDKANAQIEDFKKLPDVAAVQKTAEEYKAAAEQAKKDADAQVAMLKFDHALAAALTGAKAKNPAAVRALLKVDDLKLADDGKVIGLDDQLTAIKSDNDYLFDAEEGTQPPPKIVAGGQPSSTTSDPLWAAMLKGSGYTEPKQ